MITQIQLTELDEHYQHMADWYCRYLDATLSDSVSRDSFRIAQLSYHARLREFGTMARCMEKGLDHEIHMRWKEHIYRKPEGPLWISNYSVTILSIVMADEIQEDFIYGP